LKSKTSVEDGGSASGGVAVTGSIKTNNEFVGVTEFHADLDFVVLQGNQWERKPRVAAEPEHEGDVVDARRGSVSKQTYVSGVFTDHVVVTVSLFGSLGKLIPELEPESKMSVDSLSSDFDVDVANESMAKGVGPGDAVGFGGTGLVYGVDRKGRELDLEVDVINQVTVTRDDSGNFLSKSGVSVENLLDRFDGEVSVSAIDDLKNDIPLSFPKGLDCTLSDH
jgi:hypothetical protein